MVLHLFAAALLGPLVELLAQALVGCSGLVVGHCVLADFECLCYSLRNGWLNLLQRPRTADDSGLYCPNCAREVDDPLTCGDCSAVICRVCGTPLELPEDLGIG